MYKIDERSFSPTTGWVETFSHERRNCFRFLTVLPCNDTARPLVGWRLFSTNEGSFFDFSNVARRLLLDFSHVVDHIYLEFAGIVAFSGGIRALHAASAAVNFAPPRSQAFFLGKN